MWIKLSDTTLGEKGKPKVDTQGMVRFTNVLKYTKQYIIIMMDTGICGRNINVWE